MWDSVIDEGMRRANARVVLAGGRQPRRCAAMSNSRFEVSLRNHKDSPVTVSVIEPIPGDWEILQTSHDYQKVEAHTVQFDIPVKKNGEAKLQYRVRMRF